MTKSNFLGELPLNDVRITDLGLLNSAKKEIGYLLSFDVARLLVEFRATANMPIEGLQNYGGWENGPDSRRNPDGSDAKLRFTGHFVGHYLSALAESYASTTATDFEKNQLAQYMQELVEGIVDAQRAYGDEHPQAAGFLPAFSVDCLPDGKNGLLVPFYNLHKLLQGLIDVANYGSSSKVRNLALSAASDFGHFVYQWHIDHPQINMLKTEYGGMNEALYNLYALTDNKEHLAAAEAFDERELFTKLAANQDVLNGLHANTTIPKLVGAARRFQLFTADPQRRQQLKAIENKELTTLYLAAAKNFWQMVIDHHSYIIGDNSQSEHFHKPDELWQDATQNGSEDGGYNNNSTCETCNAHNMLKLTRLLFEVTQDPKYSDYYAHTFRNTILASQDPATGMTTYFQPMHAGYRKVYGIPGTDWMGSTDIGEFWCCQGTGIENFSKLTDSLFFRKGQQLFINGLFSSRVDLPDLNAQVGLQANLPKHDLVSIICSKINTTQPSGTVDVTLHFPCWSYLDRIRVTLNGKACQLSNQTWQVFRMNVGDDLEIQLPAKLIVCSSADNPNWLAFQYGPEVLAAKLPSKQSDDFAYAGVKVRVAKFDALAAKNATIYLEPTQTLVDWLRCIKLNDQTDIIKRIDDPEASTDLAFRLNIGLDRQPLMLIPYRYIKHDVFAVYFDVLTQQAANQRTIKECAQKRWSTRIIDQLSLFDRNNIEAGKGLSEVGDTTIGQDGGQSYRQLNTGASVCYYFKIDLNSKINDLCLLMSATEQTPEVSVAGVSLVPDKYQMDVNNRIEYHYLLLSNIVAKATDCNIQGQIISDTLPITISTNTQQSLRLYRIMTQRFLEFNADPELTEFSVSAGWKIEQQGQKIVITGVNHAKPLILKWHQKPIGAYVVYQGQVFTQSQVILDTYQPVSIIESIAQNHVNKIGYTIQIE